MHGTDIRILLTRGLRKGGSWGIVQVSYSLCASQLLFKNCYNSYTKPRRAAGNCKVAGWENPLLYFFFLLFFFLLPSKRTSRKTALHLQTHAFWTKKNFFFKKARNLFFWHLDSYSFLHAWSLAVRLQLCVGPLDRCKASRLLRVLDHRSVAEVILVPRLDAEGTLSAHAPHRLLHVHRSDVLQARETNVQRAERTWERLQVNGWTRLQ